MLGKTLRPLIGISKQDLYPKGFHMRNREKFVHSFQKSKPEKIKNSLFLIKGHPTVSLHDTDCEFKAHPESNFLYLFGVQETDCYGLIDLESGKSTLFIPKLSEDYKLWMVVLDVDKFKEKYPDIQEVLYIDELEQYLEKRNPSCLHMYNGVNSDSGSSPSLPKFEFLKKYKLDLDDSFLILNECRVIKNEEEIQLLSKINEISSKALTNIYKFARPGLKEFQLYALFKAYHELNHNIRFYSFEGISTSGKNCSVLHNVDSSNVISIRKKEFVKFLIKTIEDNSFVLCDMGAFYMDYCSDITITFPSNGKFTPNQKAIYNAVLDANRAVMKTVKPGVKWDDMHLLAERTIIQHLIQIGIVKDVDLAVLEEKRVGAIFFPHGLGHFIGGIVHDVGGYSQGCPARSSSQGLNKLRTRRILEEGMAITIEPGCYFIDFLIDKSLKDPNLACYLNKEKLDEFRNIGGVRIEDVVVITKDGCKLLVDVPRTVEEIEECMAN